jgi:hypothetical protein
LSYGEGGFIQKGWVSYGKGGGASYGEEGAHILHIVHILHHDIAFDVPYLTYFTFYAYSEIRQCSPFDFHGAMRRLGGNPTSMFSDVDQVDDHTAYCIQSISLENGRKTGHVRSFALSLWCCESKSKKQMQERVGFPASPQWGRRM